MNKTKISWADKTWNPIHGCSRISEGCRNCYAEVISRRFRITERPWSGANVSQNIKLQRHKLREPYALKEPQLVFVNSMSDLFHETVPDEYCAEVFDVMNDCKQHSFVVLTKRPRRAVTWPGPWAESVWLGVSVEDADNLWRIDVLKESAAKVRTISFEPLLGPVGEVDLTGIHWVICGGESGPNHRSMDMAWARSIRDQCVAQGVAFFFKQDSASRMEARPWIVEEDGSRWSWQQKPGKLTPPERL